MFVNFEIDTPDEDSVISFKDFVVLGNVQQPLFCLGELMKRGWVPVCDEYDSWYMQKGEAWFPVHWSRNSLATRMRISRLEEMVVQGDGEDADQRLGEPSAADQRLGTASAESNQRLGDASVEGGARAESFLAVSVRMVVVIDEEMAEHAESPEWSLSTSILPVHLAYNMSTTVDPQHASVLMSGPIALHSFGREVESMKFLNAENIGNQTVLWTSMSRLESF